MEKGRKGQNCDGFNQDLNQGYWSGTCRDSAASRGHWEKMIFQLFVLSVHYCVHSIIPNVYIQMMWQKRSPKIQEYVNAHTCLIFGTKLNNGFVLVINAAVNIKAQLLRKLLEKREKRLILFAQGSNDKVNSLQYHVTALPEIMWSSVLSYFLTF